MIVYVKGILSEKSPARVVIEACGIGYELFIPLSTYDNLPREGQEVKLLSWHCVREDDELLFGFSTEAEREMFVKLTQVSGVGPKIALAIISGSSIAELSLAISSGNAKRISAIKGVGKKTAEKICVELKDKVSAINSLYSAARAKKDNAKSGILRDAILALSALGFSEETASKMVSDAIDADQSINDVESIIRAALAAKNR